ncbi:MAG: FAD/NAD(P)-binding protein [Candidatus Sericytochromatia bacterium]
MKAIAIIGAGFCGTITAVNLIKYSTEPIKIFLIESRKEFAKGVAYSTSNLLHLLNVRASGMSAFDDEPEHFLKWLKNNNDNPLISNNINENDFISRSIYGLYLKSILDEYKSIAIDKNIKLIEINDKAINVIKKEQNIVINFENNSEILVDKLLIATGNYKPRNINIKDNNFYENNSYYQDPWGSNIFENYNELENILLIGSGLTMVDLVLSFYQRKHKGLIYVISPHGYLPQSHKEVSKYKNFLDENNLPTTALKAFKIIKNEIREAKKNNIDWRSVIDSIRPFNQRIWLNFSLYEKKSFMSHLRHRWGVLRHRMAPEIANIFDELINKHQIKVYAGKIHELVYRDNNINVLFTDKKSKCTNTLTVSKVINCTGPEADILKIDDLLIKNLINNGIIKPDEMNLGIDSIIDGNIINKDNIIEENIYTIGTNLKGLLWESTAVPELRKQTYKIALSLLK